MAEQRHLLPTHVKPLKYSLHLTPNLEAFTFAGRESVALSVKQPSKSITLHAVDINIHSAHVQVNNEKLAGKISYNKEDDTATFEFDKEVPAGDATLLIEYEGVLSDKLNGFYRSKYFLDGKEKYMACTQFEPVDARKAFPCWDEPALKATFEVTLTVPENLTALSNMPPVDESHDAAAKTKTVRFDVTPIMSTYLLAFVVGEFDFVESKTSRGITMRVFTGKGKSDQGLFALDVGSKVLSYFEDYYGVPYPLPKQDMVAIPDFAAGAMENWGLITYREAALMADEKSSINMRFRVAYVVAHELAHQWFGNLVTMDWWKELWLNEGFATWVGNQAIDHLFPEWDVWTRFVSSYTFSALNLDGLKSSHPIEVEVKNSHDIDEIFDAISYNKGAAVIRTIADFIGEANFRKGLNIYLKRHQYGNATTVDLWRAFAEASNHPVPEMMDNWTACVGYPVVQVESLGNGKFRATQKRFLNSGVASAEDDTALWWINLAVSVNGKVHPITFKTKSHEFEIAEAGSAPFVKFNSGQSGVYRVQYSAELAQQLAKHVPELSAVDRLGLQNDAFALAKAGLIPLSQALALAQQFTNEEKYPVWADLSANLGEVQAIFSAEQSYPSLQKFVAQLFKPIYKKLGWDAVPGENDLNKLLRAVVINNLASDEEVAAEAKKRFEAYVKDESSLAADLRDVVLKIVMRNGDQAEYDTMVKLYENASTPEDKIRTLRSISLTKKPELLKKTIEYAMSSGKVRDQDFYVPIMGVASTAAGREICWDFVRNSWNDLKKKFGNTQFLLNRIISFAAADFTTVERAEEVEKFFADKDQTGIERTIKQTVETIRSHASFLTRARDDTAKWLVAQGY
jgi:aminopeptidase N